MLSYQPMAHSPAVKNAYQQAGFSLIEVLLAVTIMAIGLLGMATLQTTGLNTNHSAYFRTQATNAIGDILDRMRANPDGVAFGSYDDIDVSKTIPSPQTCITQDTGCTPAQVANYDIREWAKLFSDVDNQGTDFKPQLAGASATVKRTSGTNIFTVTVTWQETDWSANRQKSLENKSVSMQLTL